MNLLHIMAADHEEKKKAFGKMLQQFDKDGENIEDIGVQKDAAIQCGFHLNELADYEIALIVRKILLYGRF